MPISAIRPSTIVMIRSAFGRTSSCRESGGGERQQRGGYIVSRLRSSRTHVMGDEDARLGAERARGEAVDELGRDVSVNGRELR